MTSIIPHTLLSELTQDLAEVASYQTAIGSYWQGATDASVDDDSRDQHIADLQTASSDMSAIAHSLVEKTRGRVADLDDIGAFLEKSKAIRSDLETFLNSAKIDNHDDTANISELYKLVAGVDFSANNIRRRVAADFGTG